MSANIQPESELSSATKTRSPETDGVPPDLTVVWDYCTWKKQMRQSTFLLFAALYANEGN